MQKIQSRNREEVKNNYRSDRGGSGPQSFPLDPPLPGLNTQVTVNLINTGTIYCNGRIKDHSTSVFSTFDMDQLGKIRGLHLNERLKISQIAKSESETSYASEDIAPQGLQTFVWWGGGGGAGEEGRVKFVSSTILTSVKFIHFEKLYLR